MAACTVPVALADPAANAATVLAQVRECHDEGVAVAVFPELCLSGYSIEDLLLQDTLLTAVHEAIATLVAASADLRPVIVVGAPLMHGTRVLNCAVVIKGGRVLGVAPKSYLPNYREFYERRHFAPGDDLRGTTIRVAGDEVPLGPDLIFAATDLPDLRLHVEICEDMWVPVPPSAEASLAGATVLSNLSGSPITIARAEDRRLLVRSASFRSNAAYIFAAAGQGESTTDLSWDGQTMVYECGDLLGESERFPDGPRRTVVDVDLDRIRQERIRQGTHDDNRRTLGASGRALPDGGLRAHAAHRRHRPATARRPLPVRARRRRAAGAGLLRGLQHPGRRPGPADAGDRPAEGRHRRQRRPRLDPRPDRRGQGDGPARTAAQRRPGVHDAGLRHRRHLEVAGDAPARRRSASPSRRSTSSRRPSSCSRTSTTRPPTARRRTTSPTRTSRPGCATTTSSGWPTSAAASSSAPVT